MTTLLAILLLLLAPGAPVVTGCDVLLTPPVETATYVDVSDDAFDSWSTFDVVDGVVDLSLERGGYQLAPGAFAARWYDDANATTYQEEFLLACDAEDGGILTLVASSAIGVPIEAVNPDPGPELTPPPTDTE